MCNCQVKSAYLTNTPNEVMIHHVFACAHVIKNKCSQLSHYTWYGQNYVDIWWLNSCFCYLKTGNMKLYRISLYAVSSLFPFTGKRYNSGILGLRFWTSWDTFFPFYHYWKDWSFQLSQPSGPLKSDWLFSTDLSHKYLFPVIELLCARWFCLCICLSSTSELYVNLTDYCMQ